MIQLARRFLEAGAHQIMIESEGITENVPSWRTDVPARNRARYVRFFTRYECFIVATLHIA